MAGAEIAFGVLGTELWSGQGLALGRKAYSQLRPPRPRRVRRPHAALRARLADGDTFAREPARGLLAPWVLHTGLGPDQAVVGLHDPGDRVRAAARRHAGAEGRRRQARRRRWRRSSASAGGELRTDAEVERILVADGRATGVRLADGETIPASRAVLACVTPTQLYGRLLGDGDVPARVREAARRLPLRPRRDADPPRPERAAALARRRAARAHCRSLHLTPGLDGVSRAVNEAERGLLPAEATIALGQPMALDPSRAPGRLVDPLGPAPGAAAAAQGRRGRRARRRATAPGPRSCARPTPTGSSARIGRHIENLELRDGRARRPLAGRHGGGEPELGRRRHLRRLVRARPEPPLPAHARVAGPRDAGRPALAHRREHASRPRARRGLRLSRRQAAHATAAGAAAARRRCLACRDALAERDLDRRPRASATTCARTRRPASTGSGSGR